MRIFYLFIYFYWVDANIYLFIYFYWVDADIFFFSHIFLFSGFVRSFVYLN